MSFVVVTIERHIGERDALRVLGPFRTISGALDRAADIDPALKLEVSVVQLETPKGRR